jgi:hypothetical protein
MSRQTRILEEATADLTWLRWDNFPGPLALGPSRRERPA